MVTSMLGCGSVVRASQTLMGNSDGSEGQTELFQIKQVLATSRSMQKEELVVVDKPVQVCHVDDENNLLATLEAHERQVEAKFT